jgi:hypothetical protein
MFSCLCSCASWKPLTEESKNVQNVLRSVTVRVLICQLPNPNQRDYALDVVRATFYLGFPTDGPSLVRTAEANVCPYQ